MQTRDSARWAGRPRLAAALRVAIFIGPVIAATAAGWGVARFMPPVSTLMDRLLLVVCVLGAATVILFVVDGLARRLLPLSTLLDLTLLFPDRAPSRLKVARDAVRRYSVQEHVARLRRAGQDPRKVAREILVLVAALDHHDRPTRGHAERVRLLTELLAVELGVPQAGRDRLRWASLLHDIGKLTISSELLNKPAKPTDEEWKLLRYHPVAGADLAAPLMPWLAEWGDVIVQHHEMYDGSGYPQGLHGEEISYGARIVSVADAFDVMTAARAYRRPVSRAAAYRELIRCSGSQFDPAVVRAMISISAPRLRRAQGAISWLSEVPVLASQTVPAATLAQALGTAALVAAGSSAIAAPLDTTGTAASASETSQSEQEQSPRVDGLTEGTAVSSSDLADEVPPTQRANAAAGGAGPTAEGPTDPSVPGGTPTVPPVVGTPPPVVPTPGGVVDVLPGPIGSVGGAVGQVVGGAGGAVGGVVVGTTGTVGGAVGGPVGGAASGAGQKAVEVLEEVLPPVAGVVGSATGGSGGGPAPAPKPSPPAGPGVGGVVGGLLGKP